MLLVCLVWEGFGDEVRDNVAPARLGKGDLDLPKRLRRRSRFEGFGVKLIAAVNKHLPVGGL